MGLLALQLSPHLQLQLLPRLCHGCLMPAAAVAAAAAHVVVVPQEYGRSQREPAHPRSRWMDVCQMQGSHASCMHPPLAKAFIVLRFPCLLALKMGWHAAIPEGSKG